MRLFRRKDRLATDTDAGKRTEGKAKSAVVAETHDLADNFLASAVRHGKPASHAHGVKRPGHFNRQPLYADDAPVMPYLGKCAYFCQQCLH